MQSVYSAIAEGVHLLYDSICLAQVSNKETRVFLLYIAKKAATLFAIYARF